LSPKVIETLCDAARKLSGSKRRAFEARVSLDYLGGDTRLTETVFGWSRHTVAKGIKEFNSGRVIPDAPRRCKPKTEDANPQLARDILELVEPHSQTDPKFQGLFKSMRLTPKAVREMLIEHKNYTSEELSVHTVNSPWIAPSLVRNFRGLEVLSGCSTVPVRICQTCGLNARDEPSTVQGSCPK